jgi:hypothetical protein
MFDKIEFDKIEFNMVNNVLTHNFDEFDGYFKMNTKLQWVKRLKELSGLGLKEAKGYCDYYFENRLKFENLNVVNRRKEKLQKLYDRTLLEKFLNDFKEIETEKLVEIFCKLPIDTLDILLEELGYGD